MAARGGGNGAAARRVCLSMRCALLVMLAVGACVRNARPETPIGLTPEEIVAHIPAKVADRDGWARDLKLALEVNRLPADAEHVCAAIAVVDQESGFHANPEVPHLASIARRALDEKAGALGPLGKPLLTRVLAERTSESGPTFSQRLDTVRTEADLDRLYRDLLAEEHRRHPVVYAATDLGARLFGTRDLDDRNPITTAGSMQVSVHFSEQHARALGRDELTVRDELYTRQGGLLYGTARLFEGTASDGAYRFADYNAGLFSSRNAAFQEQVAALTGTTLALDGDLLAYAPYSEDTQTMRALSRIRGTNVGDVRLEKSAAFEQTATWRAVKQAYEAKFHGTPAYERLPDVQLHSPKISRPLSTAWFAKAVERRYEDCLKR
jgi:hypothetical protein